MKTRTNRNVIARDDIIHGPKVPKKRSKMLAADSPLANIEMFGNFKSELNIKPNEGLGELRFLASMDQVKEYLGNPDKIDELPIVEGLAKAWYYRKLAVDLLFSDFKYGEVGKTPPHALKLTLFTSSNRRLRLWGGRIIGRSEFEVTRFLEAHGHRNLEIIDSMRNEVKSVRVADLNMDFHFKRTDLDSVQWSAPEVAT